MFCNLGAAIFVKKLISKTYLVQLSSHIKLTQNFASIFHNVLERRRNKVIFPSFDKSKYFGFLINFELAKCTCSVFDYVTIGVQAFIKISYRPQEQ